MSCHAVNVRFEIFWEHLIAIVVFQLEIILLETHDVPFASKKFILLEQVENI